MSERDEPRFRWDISATLLIVLVVVVVLVLTFEMWAPHWGSHTR